MANEIIKNGIIGTLESLVEMIANVTESEGPVHQLDIDLLHEQIRKLYREIQLLDEANRKEMHDSMQFIQKPVPEPVKEMPHEIEPVKDESFVSPVATTPEPAAITSEPVAQIVSELVEESDPEPIIIAPQPEIITETIQPEPVAVAPKPVAEPAPEPIIVAYQPEVMAETVQPEPVVIEKPAIENKGGDLFSQPVTLAEKLKKEDNSINQQMMGNNMLRNEKLTAAPISNLRTSIGINDKFMFVNELFKGEMREYDAVLGLVNDAFSEEEALTILHQNLQKQGTVEKADARGKLEKYIQRRFLK